MSHGNPLTPALLAQLRQGDQELDRGTRGPGVELALLSKLGLLVAPLPHERGGKGWGTHPAGAMAMLAVLSALGGASLSIARIYEGHVNALRLAMHLGTRQQCAEVAQLVVAGAIMAVWTADGENPVRLEAPRSGRVLRGDKAFASGLGDVTLALVSATTDEGLQLLFADSTDVARFDHSAWDTCAMVGSRSGRFDCDGLPAGAAAWLGDADDFLAEPDFHGGIWRLCACYSGAMRRLADDLAMLIDQRDLGDDALTRQRLGLAILEAESSALWAREACIAVEVETDSNRAVSTALFAREAIEASATRLIELAERIGGTSLHRHGSRTGRMIRDLRLYLRQAQLDGKLALATGCWRHMRDHGEAGVR